MVSRSQCLQGFELSKWEDSGDSGRNGELNKRSFMKEVDKYTYRTVE